MLDTIRVKYPIVPTKEQLVEWTADIKSRPTGVSRKYIYNYKLDEALLKYTYIPTDYTGNPLLMLELSLPKLLFDNNYQSGRKVRLLGVGVSGFGTEKYRQLSLFDKATVQDAKLDKLEDLVKKKFGKKSIQRAEGIRRKDIFNDFERE